MPCSRSPGRCVCSPGGVCSRGCLLQGGLLPGGGCGLLLWPSGVAYWYGLLVESGLLLWPSGVIFCYGLLVWPSGKAFWYGSLLTETFQPEGHNRRPPHQKAIQRMAFWYGLLVWPSGKAFWCDLLLWPSGMAFLVWWPSVMAFWLKGGGLCYGLLPPPHRQLLLQTVHILLEWILVLVFKYKSIK